MREFHLRRSGSSCCADCCLETLFHCGLLFAFVCEPQLIRKENHTVVQKGILFKTIFEQRKVSKKTEPKIAFDRLNDFNWATWRFRMELMLMREDIWSTVKDAKPEDATSAWTRKDEKARVLIGLALEDNQLSHIMDAGSAKEMWDKLKGYHERGSLSNKIHILRKLCSMRLNEDGSMSDHLMETSELVHRLARMGESLKEHFSNIVVKLAGVV